MPATPAMSMVAAAALAFAWPRPTPGQTIRVDSVRAAAPFASDPFPPPLARRQPNPGAMAREVGVMVGTLGVALGASAVGAPAGLDCAPCDRRNVPFFDRWAITSRRDEFNAISTGTLLAAAGVAWGDTFLRGGGLPRVGASIESATLAVATTQLLKNAAGRRRPFTYVETDVSGVNLIEARRSFPSGHTSIAFSLATSHWLSHPGERHRVSRIVVAAGAVLTGVLRVPAGRHFPTDVLAGAGVGIGSALLVHTIRF